jgi:hypothetical protein
MSRNIFDEIMEYLLKGWNPFKIQTKFKFDLLPGFLIKNPFEI